MSLDKINVTLYDLLGYVLPGFIILFAASVFEATYIHSSVFYLGRLVRNPVVVVILAYFIGQVAHALASLLKEHFREQFTDEKNRLSARLCQRIKEELGEFYDLPLSEGEGEALNTLETYQLSEAYMAISGGYLDRDIYVAREGFAKSAMVAGAFLSLILLVCMCHGGAAVQMQEASASVVQVSWYGTLFGTLAAALATFVFRRQFLFFSRIKNNYTMLAFLAHRQKELKTLDAQEPAPSSPFPAPEVPVAGQDTSGNRT